MLLIFGGLVAWIFYCVFKNQPRQKTFVFYYKKRESDKRIQKLPIRATSLQEAEKFARQVLSVKYASKEVECMLFWR
jgi:hypothetical protein